MSAHADLDTCVLACIGANKASSRASKISSKYTPCDIVRRTAVVNDLCKKYCSESDERLAFKTYLEAAGLHLYANYFDRLVGIPAEHAEALFDGEQPSVHCGDRHQDLALKK
eukprot:c334_g1_i1.p1 GENE.c334_g1_i1~~c334_g1_i1.p1  ORF type:complete len:123 (-),score=9.57 c334_g1_i1:39-374(-)